MKNMVYMFFFLRYRAQLQRTRPSLISRLEDSIFRAVEEAGGKITGERRLISASFNGDSLGFWIDILLFIENMLAALGKASDDLHGYSMVFCHKLSETAQGPEVLCRFLENEGGNSGVFLDRMVKKGLLPYIEVQGIDFSGQASRRWKNVLQRGEFFRLKGMRNFSLTAKDRFPLRETIVQALEQGQQPDGQRRNALIVGPAWAGKRDGLLRFCESVCGDFPPLIVRFGAEGINALSDAWTAELKKLSNAAASSGGTEAAAELNSLWDFVFKERFRSEQPVFTIRKAARLFSLMLDCYATLASQKNSVPVIILEHVHLAGKTAADIFINSYTGMKKNCCLVLGTCDDKTSENELRGWERVFPRLIKLNTGNITPPRPLELPPDLLEIAYAFSLFSLFFPASLVPELLAEEGKNPKMIFRSISLLLALGVIDTMRDPKPWAANFIEYAGPLLGEKRERVRLFARDRLLEWIESGRFNPCFRLLVILAGLGGIKILSDQLILKSIISDLVNGTAAGIERVEGVSGTFAGSGRRAAIRFIAETSRTLLSGDEDGIRAVPGNPLPDCAVFPVLNAQILANLSACYLGIRNHDSALETVKAAILLSQGKNNFCLAQVYRLFALINLSRQQTGEIIEYLNFAMESAEKSGNQYEQGMSAYYAAAAQFLFGNISQSVHLARKAQKLALAAGLNEWADRSRFLEGRLIFELGRYGEALKVFEEIRESPSGVNSPEKDRLMAAWAYRSRVYFQSPLCEKPASGGHDANLFEVEAAYLAGNYQRTIELASALANHHAKENFLYTERPDWRGGFAQCELLYFSRGEFQERMICVFNSLALCRVSAQGGKEAVNNMQRILRNGQLSEMDPWEAFYFYAWYRILEQTGAGIVDMNTAISIAFKRLQRRADRIDDIETRRQFLSQSRWNNALNLAAREFKLF